MCACQGIWGGNLKCRKLPQKMPQAALGNAASIDGDSEPTNRIEGSRRIGIVMGSEFDGLGRDAVEACDRLARIAMAPGVDSLNVAVAAAVLLDRLSAADRR